MCDEYFFHITRKWGDFKQKPEKEAPEERLHQFAKRLVESLDVARHHSRGEGEAETLGALRHSGLTDGEGLDAVAGEELARKFHSFFRISDYQRLDVGGNDGVRGVFFQHIVELHPEALQMLAAVVLLNEIAELTR